MLSVTFFGIALFVTLHTVGTYTMGYMNVVAGNEVKLPWPLIPITALAWTLFYWSVR